VWYRGEVRYLSDGVGGYAGEELVVIDPGLAMLRKGVYSWVGGMSDLDLL
jgi:hypothetical protein